ncbi:MAG: asparagine synthase (glutamine-hydrolyzing) [Rhodocyclaceae bacterium]|nr:asparagine synthase (glutamine-hydrolyzing) [Rhodocyclaceae bacterium]MCA3031199.1 asparagine synthase (glutamine-hydrolyzing) [Rhodocyclaceae bacterium]MCA3038624.1 asparagine synthase (glutamine-hydrolyzing) [Rhodocyclaceae bacterium]MCA3040047.1 asparagine synthase (glutamine-hydrolyzing) [Rhodocyclaceae bacterium]MCA3047167.1 asparagine synthase (glutamine-hydrolyzing) [Rhodocyclaceae bacterium]
MCGVAGFLLAGSGAPEAQLTVRRMASRLERRGPDAFGDWHDVGSGIALSHRRLAILDTSPTGAQPMHSHCDRYVTTFNGEIYNFRELRQELSLLHPSIVWRGASDTEVILAGISYWGVETTLTKLDGMFAIAVWDKAEKSLHLARDRMGEKPLYYGYVGNQFAFASELKALKVLDGWINEIDRVALIAFFRYSYIPSPLSIFKGIAKLMPGHYLKISQADVHVRRTPDSRVYWKLDDAIAIGRVHPFVGSEKEATDALEKLLLTTVGKQMVSDVPIGAFLSGGVDSSTIVSMMQAQSASPIQTFTIGFNESDFNEAEHAKAVAQHLNTEHHELYVTPKQTIDVVPFLPTLFDEPFADSSQIPTYLVAHLARSKVTVSLSGDGGDELFCGYNRYTWMYKIWGAMSPFPSPVRCLAGRVASAIPPTVVAKTYGWIKPLLPQALQFTNPADKWAKTADLIGVQDSAALYKRVVSSWQAPESLVLGGKEPLSIFELSEPQSHQLNLGEQMMRFDALTYLPDDILVKVDRASMGVSLESRVPLLDRQVVEFAWHLPMSMKLKGGVSKWILREVLYRHVPRELIERPKMGFGVPIDSWLRGELRPWAEALIDERLMAQQGYLNVAMVQKAWHEHLSGRRNWQYQLWAVLMFQAWLAEQPYN